MKTESEIRAMLVRGLAEGREGAVTRELELMHMQLEGVYPGINERVRGIVGDMIRPIREAVEETGEKAHPVAVAMMVLPELMPAIEGLRRETKIEALRLITMACYQLIVECWGEFRKPQA